MHFRAGSRTVRIAVGAVFVATALIGTGKAFAVSDGHYRYWRNHCSGSDLNSTNPNYVNPQCKALIFTISDYNGHEYLGAGIPTTPNNVPANQIDYWADPGTGQDLSWSMSSSGKISGVTVAPSTQPAANPASGLRMYFGADDNLDVGEHDSSGYVNNGPSDGGGLEVNVDPATATAWIAALQAANLPALLTHPLPLVSGGFGACADGFCISFSTVKKLAYKGLNTRIHRDVANYTWSNGKAQVWKPYNCAGPTDGSDGSNVCDVPSMHAQFGATNPCYNANGYMTVGCWNQINGTVYVEPGIQIYEDPDPQGSPGVINLVIPSQVLSMNDPYPLPSLYAGPCGVDIGGGPSGFPTHLTLPGTNAAGQYTFKTACK